MSDRKGRTLNGVCSEFGVVGSCADLFNPPRWSIILSASQYRSVMLRALCWWSIEGDSGLHTIWEEDLN